jgi:hypothetical protein
VLAPPAATPSPGDHSFVVEDGVVEGTYLDLRQR